MRGYLPATEVASELDGGFTIVLKEDTDVYMHTAPVPFGRKPVFGSPPGKAWGCKVEQDYPESYVG